MNINIKHLVLDAIQETLDLANRQVQKKRPIENIDAVALCNRFFRDLEERQVIDGDNNVFWLSAFIETPSTDPEESAEWAEIWRLIQGGFTSGFDRCNYSEKEYGQFLFNIDTTS